MCSTVYLFEDDSHPLSIQVKEQLYYETHTDRGVQTEEAEGVGANMSEQMEHDFMSELNPVEYEYTEFRDSATQTNF